MWRSWPISRPDGSQFQFTVPATITRIYGNAPYQWVDFVFDAGTAIDPILDVIHSGGSFRMALLDEKITDGQITIIQ